MQKNSESGPRIKRSRRNSLVCALLLAFGLGTLDLAAQTSPAETLKPGVYAFIIGVSNYEPQLKHGAPKAEEFLQFLKETFGSSIQKSWVFLGKGDHRVTRAEVRRTLQKEVSSIPSGSVLIFYFAGHGARQMATSSEDMSTGLDLVLGGGEDTALDNSIDLNTLHSDGILRPRGILVFSFLDCCFSGPSVSEPLPYWEDLARKRGARCLMLAACHSRESAYGGAFTSALISTLKGFNEDGFFASQLPNAVSAVLHRDFENVADSMSPRLIYGGALENNFGTLRQNSGAVILAVRSKTIGPLKVKLGNDLFFDFDTEYYRTFPILCSRRPLKITVLMNEEEIYSDTLDLSQEGGGFRVVELNDKKIYLPSVVTVSGEQQLLGDMRESEKRLTEIAGHMEELPLIASDAALNDVLLKLAETVSVTKGNAARDLVLAKVMQRSPEGSNAHMIASLASGHSKDLSALEDEKIRNQVWRLGGFPVTFDYWQAQLDSKGKTDANQLTYFFEKATRAGVLAGKAADELPDPKKYGAHLDPADRGFVENLYTVAKAKTVELRKVNSTPSANIILPTLSQTELFSLKDGMKPDSEQMLMQLYDAKPVIAMKSYEITPSGMTRQPDASSGNTIAIAEIEVGSSQAAIEHRLAELQRKHNAELSVMKAQAEAQKAASKAAAVEKKSPAAAVGRALKMMRW